MTEKTEAQESSDSIWATKYRPRTIDQLIGHEQAMTRIRGWVSTGKVPTAILLTGPTSVGKTTIARALAETVNGKSIEYQKRQQLFVELNAADQKSIDDMRELIKISKFRPQGGKKRIILVDEAQQLLTNKQAAQALLKPLEDSGSKDTIWILGSMDPGKFQTVKPEGPAILGRCSQFVLKPHTVEDKVQQALRIIKAEKMGYLKDEALITTIAEAADGMRAVANQLQAVSEYYEGLTTKPKKADSSFLAEALSSMEQEDDKVCAQIVISALKGEFAKAQLAVLDINDTFQAVNKLLWISQFLVNVAVLKGAKHRKVWWAPANRMTHTGLKGAEVTLGQYAAFLEMAVQLKNESMNFTVDAQGLISAKIYRFIKDHVAKARKD